MRRKILVVDDEENMRDMLNKALTRQNYQVFCAAGGHQALEIVANENVHLMFLDLNMPEMNGLELCRRIRKDNPIAIIIAVTGYASIFELAECREAGFDDYFLKPVKLETLFKAAEEAFEKLDRWKRP